MVHVPQNLLKYLRASEVVFLPTISINWNTNPGTAQLALDELAARVKIVETTAVGVSGFSGYSGRVVVVLASAMCSPNIVGT